jgi:putative membrane protein
MQSAVLQSLGFLCQNGPDPGYGPGYGPGLFGGYHMMSPFGGGLMVVLFLALVFIVLTRLTRRSGGGPAETALDILKKRYARGEITREDFERMKQDLKD